MVLNDVLQGTAHHQNGEEGHNPVYSRNVYESNEINYMRSNSICNAFLWQTTAFFLKKRGNRIKLKFKRCDKDRLSSCATNQKIHHEAHVAQCHILNP
jgi:hypothetical protein